jgi:hypothetical protein
MELRVKQGKLLARILSGITLCDIFYYCVSIANGREEKHCSAWAGDFDLSHTDPPCIEWESPFYV